MVDEREPPDPPQHDRQRSLTPPTPGRDDRDETTPNRNERTDEMKTEYLEMRLTTIDGSTCVRAVYTDSRGREYVIISGERRYLSRPA